MFLEFFHRDFSRYAHFTPADAPRRRPFSTAPSLHACKPASSRDAHGQAVPARSANPRPRPADASHNYAAIYAASNLDPARRWREIVSNAARVGPAGAERAFSSRQKKPATPRPAAA